MADMELALRMRADLKQAKGEIKKLRKDLKNTGAKRAERDTRAMNKELDKSQSKMHSTGSAARTLKSAIGALGVAFGASQIASFAQRTLEGAENTVRMSDAIGETVSTVQELTYTFRQFNLEQNDVADALATLSDRAEDAKDGTSSMIEDFGKIGISVDDLRNKDPGELFRLFAEGIKNTESPNKRLTAAVRTLGDDLGNKLMPLLLEGEDGLDRFAEKAREAGVVLGDEMTRGAADASREIRKMKTLVSADFAKTIVENADAIEDLAGAVGTLVGWLAKGASYYADFGNFIGESIARIVVSDSSLAKLDAAADEIERIDGRIKAIKLQPNYENNKALTDLIERLTKRRAELQKVVKSYEHLSAAERGGGTGGGGETETGSTGADTGGESDDDAEKRQQKIQAIIDKLKEQQATYGKTAQAAAVWRLEQLEATPEQIKAAQAIADNVAQLRESEQAQKDAAEAAKELAQEKQENVEADKELLATMREEIELAGLTSRERAQQIAVSRLSTEATDKQRLAVKRLAGELHDMKEKSDDANEDMSEFATQAARNMQSAFADFLYDPFESGLEGMVRGFADTIRRMTAEALAAKALQSFFGAMGGSSGGGGVWSAMFAAVQHDGGPAGSGPKRLVDPSVFAGASRYHNGGTAGMKPLASDEVPAILQTGEGILSRDDMAQIEQQQTEKGRVEVGLEDGLVARILESEAGQQSLLKVTRRNKSAMKQTLG